MTRCAWIAIAFLLVANAAAADELTASRRGGLIARAQVWTTPDSTNAELPRIETLTCSFEERRFDGRSPKFMCRISDDDAVKVKYGRGNGEVYAEVAATRLLAMLGFPADRMYPARIICRGCPEEIGEATGISGERLVDAAAIERPLADDDVPEGLASWSWTELEAVQESQGGAPRAHRDALKLVAAMLQHTDSKAEQQRLFCAGGSLERGDCDRPMLMLNDLGLTFGRASFANTNEESSANLSAWAEQPIWKTSVGCVAHLPKSFTGTLRDPVISEEGRAFLARLLARLTDAQVRALFETSRITSREPGARTGTIDQWVAAFRTKQREIEARRCLASWSAVATPLFDTGIILAMQAHERPAFTSLMNAISLFGYLRAFVALSVLLAFAYHFRAGATLLLLVALTGVLTDAAKSAAGLPRPQAVDSRVAPLTDLPFIADSASDAQATPSVDDDDVYGFPSGHVAVTTAFLLGLTLLVGWRGAWRAALLVIPVMALSRLYLGRHFPADIIGGIAIGAMATAMVVRLRLWRLEDAGGARNTALRVGAIGIAAVALGLGLDMPPPYEAGRLFGVCVAITVLGLRRELAPTSGDAPLWTKVTLAAGLYAATWWVTSLALDATGLSASRVGHLLTAALPAFILLPGPFYLARWLARIRPHAAAHS